MEQRRLRGRDTELNRLAALLDDVTTTGSGRVALMHGEPGIGKSAVLEAVAGFATERGFAVAAGKAEESDQLAPLSSLLGAFGPLLVPGDLAALSALRDQRYWLVERIAALLEARAGQVPVLVALDDVQWADPLSQFALRVLPGRLHASPVLWLLASRTELAPAADIPASIFPLAPLSAEALDEVAADLLGTAADERVTRLLEGAGGNPFLAVELLAGLSQDRPAPPVAVLHGVRARLAALTPRMQRFLRTGAVLGRRFRLADVAALLGEPETALLADLETGVRAALLDDDGDTIAFRHDLVRQAVYTDVAPSARRALHRAAAQRLQHSGRRPIEAARHLLIGAVPGDRDAVVQLRTAADEVSTVLPDLAADLTLRAVELCAESDPARFATGEQAIELLARAHRNRDAVDLADRLLTQNPPAEIAGRIEAGIGPALAALSLAAELGTRAQQAARRPGVTPADRARLGSLRALALSRGTDVPLARALGLAALAAAEQVEDDAATAFALQALGEADFSAGYCERALEYFVRVRALNPSAITWEILAHQHLDDFDTSEKLLAEARAECERPGSRVSLAAVLWAQASHDYLLGRLDRLEAGLRTLTALDGDSPPEHGYSAITRVSLSRVALLKGDLDAAREFVADARRHLGNPADPGDAAGIQAAEAWIAAASGDLRAAATIIRRNRRESTAWMRARQLRPWFASLTEMAVRGDDPVLAAELAGMAAEYARLNPGTASAEGMAAHTAALATGDRAELDRAVRILANSPRRLLYARALRDQANAQQESGDRVGAVAALTEALPIFRAHFSERETEQTEDWLRDLGASPRRTARLARPETGWDALTPTELRIARLIAAGHTNRSAAAELSISPHTVNTHLGAVYRKLGVTSRVQLVALFGRSTRSAQADPSLR